MHLQCLLLDMPHLTNTAKGPYLAKNISRMKSTFFVCLCRFWSCVEGESCLTGSSSKGPSQRERQQVQYFAM